MGNKVTLAIVTKNLNPQLEFGGTIEKYWGILDEEPCAFANTNLEVVTVLDEYVDEYIENENKILEMCWEPNQDDHTKDIYEARITALRSRQQEIIKKSI